MRSRAELRQHGAADTTGPPPVEPHAPAVRPPAPPAPAPLSDEDVVRRILAGDPASFELIMRRYNQRLFRVARSIVRDSDEAEDVLQEAYVRAFQHLRQFEGRARFSTWLTRIVVHEAAARRRKQRRMHLFDPSDHNSPLEQPGSPERAGGEDAPGAGELRETLAAALDDLPDDLRTVFTLRAVQGLDTDETAACLEITPANVKVRLHRARALLRVRIDERIGEEARRLHQFDGARCDRLVERVLARLAFPGTMEAE